MGKTGKGLGIFALLLAIGALGLSLFQFIVPSPSEGSKIYSATNHTTFYLNSNTFVEIPNLNLSYSSQAGDSVLLEFSCQISVELFGSSTQVDVKFEVDSLPPSPDTEVSVVVHTPEPYLHSPFMIRHVIPSSSAGAHVVNVIVRIDDIATTSFVRYCVLTATVY